MHRLTEKAIRAAQGPADHCILLDELSYAVTFNDLTLAEASRVTATVARDVCRHLFGSDIDEVSVRSIVAEIAVLGSIDAAEMGRRIEIQVEAKGVESIISHSVESGSSDPVVVVAGKSAQGVLRAADRLKLAHAHFAPYGLKLGLLPIWNLKRGTSNCLFLTPFSGDASGVIPSGRLQRIGVTDAQMLELEIEQLMTASAFAEEMHAERRVCALGVGVSYYSLNGFRARIRYLTALQKAAFHAKNPLLLKIEQIPEGAPEGRVSELVAMLSRPHVRVTLEFENLANVTAFDLRTGPIGVGGILSPHLDLATATQICQKLVYYAPARGLFVFMDHLDQPERVALAARENVAFGMGAALTRKPFEVVEPDLRFPLRQTLPV